MKDNGQEISNDTPCVHVGKLILLQHLKVNNFRKMFTNAEHGQSPSAVILLFYGLETV